MLSGSIEIIKKGLNVDNDTPINYARSIIEKEIAALVKTKLLLGDSFQDAISIFEQTQGRIIVIGMGKSGIIGKKIAATMASTGTPAFFVHPGEAFHGDLGMIKKGDSVLFISNSGETEELLKLIPYIQYLEAPLVSILGSIDSTLAKYSSAVLDGTVNEEACNNNLAPTSSTTVALVLGDAVAITLSSLKKFKPMDFARFHPGGSLGKKLLTKVKDVMTTDDLPVCEHNAGLKDIVEVITQGRLGLSLVKDNGTVIGIVTDGDLRSAFEASNPLSVKASDIVTVSPYSIHKDQSLASAEEMMLSIKKRVIVVHDDESNIVGVLQVFDL